MTDNNNHENKQEAINEEEKKKELSMEDLEQVTGGGLAPFNWHDGAPVIDKVKDN